MAANSLSLILLRRVVTEPGSRSRVERMLRRYTSRREVPTSTQDGDRRRVTASSNGIANPTTP
jgi:hypothetical protein